MVKPQARLPIVSFLFVFFNVSVLLPLKAELSERTVCHVLRSFALIFFVPFLQLLTLIASVDAFGNSGSAIL